MDAESHGSYPPDLAFLAMAHFRLGHADQARHFLARLRETTLNDPRWQLPVHEQEAFRNASPQERLKNRDWARYAEHQACLREAEELIEGKK
jgi:hypothetical protein